jgi:aryl-alcohol dehydrogenase-like predicted oxidoreductase
VTTRDQMRCGHVEEVANAASRLVIGTHAITDRDQAFEVLDAFADRGGTVFDSAWMYQDGLQERLLGEWLTSRAVHDEVMIIAKGGHTPHCDPSSIALQLTQSVERLQTDEVDLYLLHHDNETVPVQEFVEALNIEIATGRVRAYGFSNWSIQRFSDAQQVAAEKGLFAPMALSNHFGLARALDLPWPGGCHVTDQQSRHWLVENQIPNFAWSSQSRGFFARANPRDHSDPDLVRCYYSDDNFERLRRAQQMADQRKVLPTAVALAYVLAQEFPSYALIGPLSADEVRTSIEMSQVELSAEEVAWLDLRS